MTESRGQRGFIPPKMPAPAPQQPAPQSAHEPPAPDPVVAESLAPPDTPAVAPPQVEASRVEQVPPPPQPIGAGWLLLVPAAAAIAYAIVRRDGVYDPVGIGFIAAALVLATAGVLVPLPRWRPWMTYAQVALLGLALAVQFWFTARYLPVPNLQPPSGSNPKTLAEFMQLWVNLLLQYTAVIAVAALFAGAVLSRRPFLRAVTFPALVVAFVVFGAWVIRNTAPNIDVYLFQQQSCDALAKGQNPYAMNYPDPYHGQSPWFGPGLAHDDRLWFGYPYMPLTLLMTMPGWVIGGDCRYASLAAIALAALMIGYSRNSRVSFGAAALLMFMSRTPLVIEESWTEPFVILLLAGTLFCAIRLPRVMPFVLGLFLASKQYVPLALPLVLLLCDWPLRWRQVWNVLWKAGLTAVVVTLPMVVWNFGAFWHSAVHVQMVSPFRRDALSVLAWWYARSHGELPPGPPAAAPTGAPSTAWAFVALLVGMGFSLWRAPRGVVGFCGAIAFTFLLFFAFNKQAFANYYFFVFGALCCAVAGMRLPDADG